MIKKHSLEFLQPEFIKIILLHSSRILMEYHWTFVCKLKMTYFIQIQISIEVMICFSWILYSILLGPTWSHIVHIFELQWCSPEKSFGSIWTKHIINLIMNSWVPGIHRRFTIMLALNSANKNKLIIGNFLILIIHVKWSWVVRTMRSGQYDVESDLRGNHTISISPKMLCKKISCWVLDRYKIRDWKGSTLA